MHIQPGAGLILNHASTQSDTFEQPPQPAFGGHAIGSADTDSDKTFFISFRKISDFRGDHSRT